MKLIGFIIGIAIINIAAYLGGFNFDERGGQAITVFVLSILFGIYGLTIAHSFED